MIQEFFRRTSIVAYDRKALAKIRTTVETLAGVEGMGAHAASVAVRFASSARPTRAASPQKKAAALRPKTSRNQGKKR
jgi:hypothetical protein